jgi:hypothetical protein
MTWNYRVVRNKVPHGDSSLGIYEVYYNGEGKPYSYTQHAVTIDEWATVEEIRWTLARMLEATDKPVLSDEDFV